MKELEHLEPHFKCHSKSLDYLKRKDQEHELTRYSICECFIVSNNDKTCFSQRKYNGNSDFIQSSHFTHNTELLRLFAIYMYMYLELILFLFSDYFLYGHSQGDDGLKCGNGIITNALMQECSHVFKDVHARARSRF